MPLVLRKRKRLFSILFTAAADNTSLQPHLPKQHPVIGSNPQPAGSCEVPLLRPQPAPVLPHLVMGHYPTVASWKVLLDKLLSEQQAQTNQLSQMAAMLLLSNHTSRNQVQRGIKEDYLGHPDFFLTSYAALLPSVVKAGIARCTPTWKEEEICFPQHGCLATTAVPRLWWEPSIPLQRDPLCNPNWGLFKTRIRFNWCTEVALRLDECVCVCVCPTSHWNTCCARAWALYARRWH